MKRWKWWILSLLDEPRASNRHSHQSYEEEHEEGVEEQVRREGGGVSAVAFLCSSSSTSSIRRGVRAPPRVIKNPLRVFQTRETKYKLAAARLAGGVTKDGGRGRNKRAIQQTRLLRLGRRWKVLVIPGTYVSSTRSYLPCFPLFFFPLLFSRK